MSRGYVRSVSEDAWIEVADRTIVLDDAEVRVAPFIIARWPVTVGQYETFERSTGYLTVAQRLGRVQYYRQNSVLHLLRRKRSRRLALIDPRVVSDPDLLEAGYLSHADATAYCAWSGTRLPTEAEWLSAAVIDWSREHDDCIAAINESSNDPRALRSLGCEWVAERGERSDLQRPLRADFPLLPRRTRPTGEWAVLRGGPKFVLPRDYQTVPFAHVAPIDYFNAFTMFRVVR